MAKKPESRLQRRIVKALKKAYPKSWWVKFHGGPFSAAGVPDLLGCVNGYFYALEVKNPGKLRTVTAVQSATIKIIQNAGGISCALTSPDEALAVVAAFEGSPKERRHVGAQTEWLLSGLRSTDWKDVGSRGNHSSASGTRRVADRTKNKSAKHLEKVSEQASAEVSTVLRLRQLQHVPERRWEDSGHPFAKL